MNVYVCDRLAPETRAELVFEVYARDTKEAAYMAGEVAYAAGWVQGTYPSRDHKAPPEQWAVTIAEGALSMGLVDAMEAAVTVTELPKFARGLDVFIDSFGDLVLA